MATQQEPAAPLPQWLVTLIGMAVAIGISYGVSGARQDALADRLARAENQVIRIENQVTSQTVELTRVARLEERLTAMSVTLTEIRNELRYHDGESPRRANLRPN